MMSDKASLGKLCKMCNNSRKLCKQDHLDEEEPISLETKISHNDEQTQYRDDVLHCSGTEGIVSEHPVSVLPCWHILGVPDDFEVELKNGPDDELTMQFNNVCNIPKTSSKTSTEQKKFKIRHRGPRSLSNAETKLQRYSENCLYEVFDEDVEETGLNLSISTTVRKCNSLPDIITNLSSTSSYETHSSPTPDLTIHVNEENIQSSHHELIRKRKQREVIEGISSLPQSGRSDTQKPETSLCPRSERSVSISDKITAKTFDGSDCPKDIENTKETVALLMTPTNRQTNQRISSGYGSDRASHHKSEKGNHSSVETVNSDVWISQESDFDKDDNVMDTNIKQHDAEMIKLSIGPGDCVMSSQSGSTFIGRSCTIEHDQHHIEPECVLPNLSIFSTVSNNHGRKDNIGNVPNGVSDESFSLPKSVIDKVVMEEADHRLEVLMRYCREQTSIDNFGKPLYTGDFRQGLHSWDIKEFEDVLMRFSPSLIEHYLQLTSVSTTPSPSPYTVEKYRLMELVDGLKAFTMEDLLRSSRCRYRSCEESSCKKMAVIRKIFKMDLPEVDSNSNLVQAYCLLLWEHSQECTELMCPVLYCSEIMSCQINKTSHDMIIKLVKEYIQSKTLKPFMSYAHEGGEIVHKLMQDVPYQNPALFTTHIPLFTIDDCASVCLEVDTKRVCVVHDYPLLDYEHQLALYQHITQVNHANIVPHLWLLESNDNVIQVCSLFCQGGSLQDLLTGGPLPWEQCLYYMQQILEAVIYLQTKHGIVYLNWRSGNVQFPDCNRLHVQLGNFSLSCPLKFQCDIGAIKQCLPANICPPELLHHNKVEFPSDSWGAGCLLYEMFTGFPVLHRMRHDTNEIIHNKVKAGLLHLTANMPQDVQRELQLCWEVVMEKRVSIQEIRQWTIQPSANRLAAKPVTTKWI